MVNFYKRAAKSAIFLFAAIMLANLFGYLTRGLLTRTLSQSDFGLFYAMLTFFFFVTIPIDLGFGSALIKHISQFNAKHQYRELYSSIALVAIVKISLSIVVALLIILAAPFLAANYFKSPTALPALYFVGLFVVLSTIMDLFDGIFSGFQRMYLVGAQYFLQKFIFFAAAFGFIMFSNIRGVMMPVYAFLISSFGFLVFSWKIFGLFQWFKKPLHLTWGLFKRLGIFAIASLMNSVGFVIIGYIDVMLLTYFRTLPEVGVYNTVLPTALIMTYLASSMAMVLFPIASELWTKKARARLIKGIELLYDYLLFLTLPASIILIIYPDTLLGILFGPSYGTGAVALRIVSAGVIMASLFRINSSVLSGIGRPQDVTKAVLPAALLNFAVNLFAIPRFGMSGAAFATTLSYILMMVISTVLVVKFTGFRMRFGRLALTLTNAGLFAVFLLLMKAWLPGGLLWLFIGVVISGLAYLGLGFLLRIINFKEILKLNPLKKA